MAAQELITAQEMTTIEAARYLGLAVRSVQLMVDRGDLEAWKTPGGHRRIARSSLDRWLAQRNAPGGDAPEAPVRSAAGSRILLIEDSQHFQNLVRLVLSHDFPDVEFLGAGEAVGGLIALGRHEPDVVLVDILLPGIDGAALISGLRSQPDFDPARLIVVTSLSEEDRAPYRFALEGLRVIHKPNLVAELPGAVRKALGRA